MPSEYSPGSTRERERFESLREEFEQESHRETERVPSAGWRAVYQAMGGGWP